MVLIALYGAAPVAAVLVSGLAARTVLSTALLFLLAGAVVSAGGFGLVSVDPQDPIEARPADLALFSVLFTDACGPESASSARAAGSPAGRSALACR